LVIAYHPSEAFDSVQKIKYILPFGYFFRKLHYFSSEAFVMFLFLHIAIELLKKKIYIDNSSWFYSVIGVVLVIFLMFSGFVLKGDLSANAAAQVAFNLIKDTPLLKTILPLFYDAKVFYYRFFIWHILFFPLLLGFAIYKHVKILQVKSLYFSIALGISAISMIVFAMPKDINPTADVNDLSSPWFFEGAEKLLLRSFSPVSVNIVLLIPIVLLIVYHFTRQKSLVKILLFLWLLIYSYISIGW